ncbi:MAG: helix-turn-helix transcriptional regulator [Butyrivibrio sp.]|nr:helix-turn-helix transcriptional regulator [Butyrivibrio sp.]
MEYPTKLATYYSILRSRFPAEMWEYNNCLELVSRHSPEHELEQYFLRYSYAFTVLREQFAHARTTQPLILSDRVGLMWIACYSRPDHIPQHLYVFGPIFSGDGMKEVLISSFFGKSPQIALCSVLQRFPVIPMNEMLDIATMIHYCITQETIPPSEVLYRPDPKLGVRDPEESTAVPADLGLTPSFYDWMMEGIRNGSPIEPLLSVGLSDLSGYGHSDEEILSHAQPATIILADRMLQSAITVGMPPKLGQNLRDRMIHRIYACSSPMELSGLRVSMYTDYARLVQRYRDSGALSRPIQLSCDYIRMHITEPLPLQTLAELCGYTEYYYSRKFKREVGLTPSEFINQTKIFHAKLLLKDSNDSIQAISEQLQFSSRTYFTRVFEELAGVTPSSYRKSARQAK